MAGNVEPVAIPGLARLRQDMRLIQRSLLTELRKAEAEAAVIIARDAAARAPRGTRPLPKDRKKRLADTVRPIVRGNRVGVGATKAAAPHANVVHWGGTIRPKGKPIRFQRRPFVLEAFDAHRDEFVALLAVKFDELARRHGFR